MIEIKVKKIRENAIVPAKAKDGDSCFDLSYCPFGNDNKTIVISPGETRLIGTGLTVEIPIGYEGQVRPRSGIALKKSVTVLNTPGTIDSGYRGEIGVIMINHGKEAFTINAGDRIAQFSIQTVIDVKFTETEKLSTSDRGFGGFGHTGVSTTLP